MKWTNAELNLLKTLETRSISLYQLWLEEFKRKGSPRSYDSVEKAVRRLCHSGKLTVKTGRPEQKMAYLDIETTHLKGNFGIILTWALKGRDEKKIMYDSVTKEELFSLEFDRRITASLLKAIEPYDVLVHYFGTRFDVPYLRTKALEWNLPFPGFSQKRMFDLYYLARSKLSLHSNRLGVVCDFLGIKGKTSLQPRIWKMAAYGHKASLEYILRHNIADVRILERAHKRLESAAKGIVRSV